jgi:HSP20 family protein
MANMVPLHGRNRGLMGSDDFYSMIDNFFSEPWFMGRYGAGAFKVDVQQRDNEYLVEAELPGINREEVDLQLSEGNLQISVKREESVNDEGRDYIHRERHYSSMSRSIYLGDAAAEGIKAKLDNGVLKIIVPRQKKIDQSKRIEIE